MTDDIKVIATSEPQRSAPRFACFPGEHQSQYFLFVESEVLCITNSFSQALMLWFATHYVLNLEYCPKTKVALFMQVCFQIACYIWPEAPENCYLLSVRTSRTVLWKPDVYFLLCVTYYILFGFV